MDIVTNMNMIMAAVNIKEVAIKGIIMKGIIMKGIIMKGIMRGIIMKAWVWRLQCCMHYVLEQLFLADVIQSIGLLISALIIFFVGSNMGHTVT